LTVPDQKSPVLYDARDGGVAVVTLNRPDRLNAWGGGLATEFYRCMDRAEADASQLVGERHPHFVTGLRKPVIAAINGACAGIGLTQALMCGSPPPGRSSPPRSPGAA
jgi:enoyl-CoA hydratase/carnithine racemase